MVGVLQTWTRDLRYHPHIHYLVPAGALAPDGSSWLAAKGQFLVHVKPLAALFRGKVRAGLRQLRLETRGCERDMEQAVGGGLPASREWRGSAEVPRALRLSGRAAATIGSCGVVNDQVTFRYRDGDTKKTTTCTLPAEEFIDAFCSMCCPKAS